MSPVHLGSLCECSLLVYACVCLCETFDSIILVNILTMLVGVASALNVCSDLVHHGPPVKKDDEETLS